MLDAPANPVHPRHWTVARCFVECLSTQAPVGSLKRHHSELRPAFEAALSSVPTDEQLLSSGAVGCTPLSGETTSAILQHDSSAFLGILPFVVQHYALLLSIVALEKTPQFSSLLAFDEHDTLNSEAVMRTGMASIVSTVSTMIVSRDYQMTLGHSSSNSYAHDLRGKMSG